MPGKADTQDIDNKCGAKKSEQLRSHAFLPAVRPFGQGYVIDISGKCTTDPDKGNVANAWRTKSA
jgi:hypothetical protein